MGGKGGEVDIQGVEIHGHMRHRLAGVQNGQSAHLMGPLHDGRYIGDRPGHIRHMGEGHDLGPWGDDRFQLLLIGTDPPVFGQVQPAQGGSRPEGQLLERQQNRMMFSAGDDYLIACFQGEMAGPLSPTPGRGVAESGGQQIKAGRGPCGHHQLLGARLTVGTDQGSHLGAGGFESLRAAGGKLMGPPVHAGVDSLVEIGLSLNHLPRLLRCCGGIQIDQRIPMNLLVQNGELLAYGGKISHETSTFFYA